MMESSQIRDCQAFEIALCDYLDGTLSLELRAELEGHLSTCALCAAYERDVRWGLNSLRAAEALEVPGIVVNKILFQIPAKATGLRGWFGRLLDPVLQPRVVMGAMMTVLSLAMMTRCAGVPSRSLTSSDLDPVKIWGSFDDRLHRTWDRTLKAYESMRLVYEVRSRVSEWRQQQQEQETAAAEEALRSKQLPLSGSASSRAGSPSASPTEPGKAK